MNGLKAMELRVSHIHVQEMPIKSHGTFELVKQTGLNNIINV